MKDLFGLILGFVLLLAIIGGSIALAVWSFTNIWLVLGILAGLLVIAIIYAMATSENEIVRSITWLTIIGIAVWFYLLIKEG